MKTTLTIEESARLIELGVDAKLASSYGYKDTGKIECGIELPPEFHLVFRLEDLLSILLKEIKIDGYPYRISIYFESPSEPVIGNQWCAYYRPIKHNERSPRIDDVPMYAPELIDALYQLAIWCLENGHLKTEKE